MTSSKAFSPSQNGRALSGCDLIGVKGLVVMSQTSLMRRSDLSLPMNDQPYLRKFIVSTVGSLLFAIVFTLVPVCWGMADWDKIIDSLGLRFNLFGVVLLGYPLLRFWPVAIDYLSAKSAIGLLLLITDFVLQLLAVWMP